MRATSIGLLAVTLVGCAGASTPAARPASSGPELHVGGAVLRVRIDPAERALDDEALLLWTERAATMVDDYCGGFPVSELEVRLRTGGGLGWGTHTRGRRVMATVGRTTTAAELERDWVLVHEMLHVAFPDVAQRHRWMREGLSTYLETVLRARSGIYDETRVWEHWTSMMSNGVPRPGDRGLDQTRSWGALYWGGALFWLMVDVELRARTDNERSVRDVVRGALARGGNSRVRWTTARVAEVADETTGTSVFSELYDSHARRRGDVDLDGLFERLGVVVSDEGVSFDDDAPLAHVRRAMNAPEGPALPPIARTAPSN